MAQNDISDQQQYIPNKRSNNHDIWYSGANLIFQEEFFKVFETFLFHHLQQAKKGQKVAQNDISCHHQCIPSKRCVTLW